MKVYMKEPGKRSRTLVIDKRDLALMQELVGGYIETVTFGQLVIICDEDGRIKNKPHCCKVGETDFVGTILAVGTEGEDFADVPVSMETWRWMIGEGEKK